MTQVHDFSLSLICLSLAVASEAASGSKQPRPVSAAGSEKPAPASPVAK